MDNITTEESGELLNMQHAQAGDPQPTEVMKWAIDFSYFKHEGGLM